jgi:hypothetical protein
LARHVGFRSVCEKTAKQEQEGDERLATAVADADKVGKNLERKVLKGNREEL